MKQIFCFLLALCIPAFCSTQVVVTLTGTGIDINIAYGLDTTSNGIDSFYIRWTDQVKYSGELDYRSTTDYKFMADTNELNNYIQDLQDEYDALEIRATILSEQAQLKAKRIKAIQDLRDSVIRGMDLTMFSFQVLDPVTVNKPNETKSKRCRLLAIFRRKKKRKLKQN